MSGNPAVPPTRTTEVVAPSALVALDNPEHHDDKSKEKHDEEKHADKSKEGHDKSKDKHEDKSKEKHDQKPEGKHPH